MKRWLLLLCVAPLLSCATITTGTHETITVTSSPAAAVASLTCGGGQDFQPQPTPATFTIRRNGGDCLVTLTKEGFEQRVIAIEQGVNPAYWANLLFSPAVPIGAYSYVGGNANDRHTGTALMAGGLLFIATDFWTGAAHAHKPNHVDVVLKPKE